MNKEKALYYRNLISENEQDKMLWQVPRKALHRILDKVIPSHESKKSLALAGICLFIADKISDILETISHTDSFEIPPSWSLLVSWLLNMSLRKKYRNPSLNLPQNHAYWIPGPLFCEIMFRYSSSTNNNIGKILLV